MSLLPLYTQDWPPRWRDAYQEREAIMCTEGVQNSEAKAEADIRRQAEAEGQQCIFSDVTDWRRR